MEDKRGEPWTVDDVDRLFVLLNQGLRKRDMSFYLLRTENAIRAKLWRIMKEHQRKKERFMDLPETTVRGWFMILTNKPLFTEIERDGYVIKNIGPNMISVIGKGTVNKAVGQWLFRSDFIEGDPHQNKEIIEDKQANETQLSLF